MMKYLPFLLFLLLKAGTATAQNNLVVNGIPWFDDKGDIVNAHGACIVEENGRYYLFGEWKSDKSNAFPGFSCYSSDDLVNWKFESIVLRVQPEGILGPNRVGERVKVMKCPKTGEYIMLMHADDMGYKDPYIGLATCKTIAGDYQLQGPLLYKGQPIKRWDMGTFQDTDGKGYLLIHHGPVYRLSDDYRSIEAEVAHIKGMGESPAMFKKNGVYFMLTSNLTSWEKNDNFYFTAPQIEGPWTKQGLFCPEGKLTYNSQSTFVFPLKCGNDTIPMFMGDRWSYPHQASAATYVWMPLQVDGTKISIPEYWQARDIKKLKPADALNKGKKLYGSWKSNQKGDVLEIAFKGTHVAIVGETNPHGGYAKVNELNAEKDTVYSSLVDFYSKYPEKAIRIITPKVPKANYEGIAACQWHILKLRFEGNKLTGFVDGQQVVTANSMLYPRGMAGLMAPMQEQRICTPYFDNVRIMPVGPRQATSTLPSLDIRPLYQ